MRGTEEVVAARELEVVGKITGRFYRTFVFN
jgi:hypothetical protein